MRLRSGVDLELQTEIEEEMAYLRGALITAVQRMQAAEADAGHARQETALAQVGMSAAPGAAHVWLAGCVLHAWHGTDAPVPLECSAVQHMRAAEAVARHAPT